MIHEVVETRRRILKLGASLLGVAAPLVITLPARAARAPGSWSPEEEEEQGGPIGTGGWYGWHWRNAQRRRKRINRYYRNRYGGIGDDD